MSMHPNPAERLLSMLEEAGAVESLPVADVREELAVLGIDPARSIAFAKSLARDGDSPGGRLMGALLAGEEEDEEIARIESADIEDVRAHIPHAAAAAIAAEARRKAGIDDNLVGLDAKRRKRRRLIIWGGPLAGIAASFLIVVVFMGNAYLSSQRSEISNEIAANQAEAPAPEMPNPALDGYIKPGPGKSLTDELLAMDVPPELGSAERAKENDSAGADAGSPSGEVLALNEPAPAMEKKSVAPAKPEERLRKQEEDLPPPVASSPPAAGVIAPRAAAPSEGDSRARDEMAEAEPELPAIIQENVPLDGLGGSAGAEADVAAEAFQSEAETAALPQANQDGVAAFGRSVEISEIVAVLVVDPSRAPLQIQSPILPSGELANRVEEARRLAGDRAVIALYSVATGDASQDYAQIPLQTGFTQQMAAPSPLVGLLGVEATEYDFIALPAE
jgi:hypothetical protein